MSWWQRALGVDDGEDTPFSDDAETLGGGSAMASKGGVREDLSEFTQSLGRGLGSFGLVKGFGNFLAGEPVSLEGKSEEEKFRSIPARHKNDSVQEEPVDAVGEAKDGLLSSDRGTVQTQAEPQSLVDGDNAEARKAVQSGSVAHSESVELESVKLVSVEEEAFAAEHAPPKMRGLKADMFELTGTLSSSISRFSSVIRVVTGEDLLPRQEGNAGRASIEGESVSNAAAKDPRLPSVSSGSSSNSNPNMTKRKGVDHAAGQSKGAQQDLQALTGSIAMGFSKLASHLPEMLSLVKRGENEDDSIEPEAVGIKEEVIAFATSIASHPETWLDFPLSTDETAQDLTLTELQEDHVYVLEQEAPQVAAIRTELCPAFMSEERFWRVYFVLLASHLGNVGAVQLLTPEILAERKLLLEKLRTERGPLAEDASEGDPPKEETVPGGNEQTGVGSPVGDAGGSGSSEALQAEGRNRNAAAERADVVETRPPADEDEEDVDNWLDDEDETGGDQGPIDPHEAEESSFRDLEEEEGASKDVVPTLKPVDTKVAESKGSAETSSEPHKGAGWVQLHRTPSQGLKTVSSNSDFEQETSGEGSPTSPAATSASHQGGSRTNSESGNEWLTVDAEDGRSTVS